MEIAIVTLWLSCGVFASAVATSKQRRMFLWFALGILFGPIALFSVGSMPALGIQPFYNAYKTTPCKRCNTLNNVESTFCVECGIKL